MQKDVVSGIPTNPMYIGMASFFNQGLNLQTLEGAILEGLEKSCEFTAGLQGTTCTLASVCMVRSFFR